MSPFVIKLGARFGKDTLKALGLMAGYYIIAGMFGSLEHGFSKIGTNNFAKVLLDLGIIKE